jgi:phosphatidylserine/phosphatidylglycerophosphate/cardiolipin synthase-like enzyme
MKRKRYLNFLLPFSLGCMTGALIQLSLNQRSCITLAENTARVLFTYPKQFRELGFVECERQIVELIDTAQSSIYAQSYNWTSVPIAKSLIRAKERGVQVFVLLDKSNDSQSPEAMEILLQNSIPVRIRKISGISHNKVMVLDEQIVITGSYNFTKSANERNDENILIVSNNELAKQYLNNWKKCNEYSFLPGSYSNYTEKLWDNKAGYRPDKSSHSIKDYIDQAKQSIYIVVGIGDTLPNQIAELLEQARKKGLEVKVLQQIKASEDLVKYKMNSLNIKVIFGSGKITSVLVDGNLEIILTRDEKTGELIPKKVIKSNARSIKFERDWKTKAKRVVVSEKRNNRYN